VSATVVAPNKPVGLHLEAVQREMRTRGAPTIRAWWDGEKWIALEGSHRLAAAHALDLTPYVFPDCQRALSTGSAQR
jgi:hypothetical protein